MVKIQSTILYKLHFHYVLSMGAVFALFSAWYFWVPKISGLEYSVGKGKAHFWIMFVGVWLKGRAFYISQKKRNYLNVTPDKYNGGSPNKFVMFFKNIETSKKEIYKSLRNKSGVYMFINNITEELYVGSSVNLTNRMTNHFYHAKSKTKGKTIINRAMYKYKLENFSLGIVEFCVKDIIVCTTLEQKWIDHYKFNYNILKISGSSFAFTHSINTIVKLKEQFKKENHPKYGSTISLETKEAIKQGIKKFYFYNIHPYKGKTGKLSPQYDIGGSLVFCYNKENKELMFPSINAARQHFKVRWTYIKKNIDTKQSLFLNGEYWTIQSIPRDIN